MVSEVGRTAGSSTRYPRLRTLDCLRGIAALSVAWYHVTCGNPRFAVPEVIKASGAHGWLGVEVFFVISGFVIPYALYGARYRLRDYGRFLLKRIVRLDPPYLVSLGMVAMLAYASAALPGFRGRPPSFTVPQLASHVGYATGLLGYEWVNIAYWSLALEFQYYL